MRFLRVGLAFKVVLCVGGLALIVFAALGFAAIRLSAIDGELERTLAARGAEARDAERLYDCWQNLARLRWRRVADVGGEARSRAVEGFDADAGDSAALFDAMLKAAPGLAPRIEAARRDFARLSLPGNEDGTRSAGAADDLLLETRKLRDEIADAIQVRSESAYAKARDARAAQLEGLAALFAAAFGTTFFALRLGVNVPIRTLASALRSSAPTGLHTLPGLDRQDEVGEIARSFMTATAALSAEMKAEADRIAQSRQSEVETWTAESRKALEGPAQTLTRLGAAMKRLAAGDLTIRLGESVSGGDPQLAGHFDSGLNRVAKAVLAFATSASAIQSTVRQISTTSNGLAQRSEQQGHNLEKASAAVSHIAARASEAGEGAARTRRHVAALDREVVQTAAGIKQASESLEIVTKAADEVSGMTALVDEIAFQTTLLALNASVEAARAGEVGRGISVVALELRALAQRSTQAAREFEAGFSASTAQMRKGAALLAETEASMDRIKQRAAEIETAVSEIGVEASDQSKDIREIRGALDRIGAAARQNGEAAADVTSESQSLDEVMGKLSDLLRRFDVGAAGAKFAAEPQARASARANWKTAPKLQSNSS